MRLKSRKCIITGAGSGIGRAIAKGYAREGATVVIADASLRGAEETATSIRAEGFIAEAITVDVRFRDQVEHMMFCALERLGGLDIMVCAAGISPVTHFLDISEEEWDRVIDTNLKGLFLCGQAAARHMKTAGGGVIINVTSQLSEVAQPKCTHYVASKGGAKMITKGMVVDLAQYNIRINSLAPGLTNTPMNPLDTPEGMAEYVKVMPHIPMGRVGQPEDMVGAAVFLASDESSYVTGATVLVDGGYLAL
ncbi:SDR family NAD(P)-dependent oxidoreductase [Aestuariivirga sp.]|uniref:SDR family NAD(P)-dependent oxidoreductase n=1 Tax=Aestuariivirga sp. TaxID=2650926 RepID=UPI00391C6D31